jgi:hypothetical protein
MKQVKLEKNNHAVLNMMLSNSDGISLSKEDLNRALEFNKDFFTLRTSYKDFEIDIKSINNKLSNTKNILISFEDDDTTLNKIKNCMNLISANILDDTKLIFGTKEIKKLSKYPIIIFLSAEIY